MTDFVIFPQKKPLKGSVPVPSDKSIGHRSILFGALAEGQSEVRGFSYGEDNVSTMKGLAAMGVRFDDDGAGVVRVHGVGLEGLRAPAGPIDCGNSGTTMRLFAGLLAAQHFQTTLIGDESLTRRPMARVADPLRRRGAKIEGVFSKTKPGDITAPLVIGPLAADQALSDIEFELKIASAQVKSALLISGMYASGPTVVREPVVSRDHTERMMRALEVPLEAVGPMVRLDPSNWRRGFSGFSIEVPGDPSAAAFILAAGLVVPESVVSTRSTCVNPTRTGFLDIVRQMGGELSIEVHGDSLGEPQADLRVASSALRAATIAGEVVTRAIDEIPIASALAARARGTTEIADAAELRVKESDRIAEMVKVLRAFGVEVEERPDGMVIQGQPEGVLRAAEVDCHGDHRIGMTSSILGLLADGKSRVKNVDCIATSFPKFVGTLRALGAEIEVVGG